MQQYGLSLHINFSLLKLVAEILIWGMQHVGSFDFQVIAVPRMAQMLPLAVGVLLGSGFVVR
jgi:hypothetical protein